MKYDVIVVFGAAVWSEGRPSPALLRRTLHAVSLVQAGLSDHILVTGGLGKYPPSEARVMSDIALDSGLPPPSITMEERGTNTLFSAMECLKIIRSKGWSSALIVTDRYHIPRSRFIFRALGIQADGNAPPGGCAANRKGRWFLFYVREFFAFPWYCMRIIPKLIDQRKA